MTKRTAQFVSVLFATILAGANFAAGAEDGTANSDGVKTADNCLASPKGPTPAGGHWRYRLDRATKRKCWYVREDNAKAPKAASVQQDSAPAADTASPPAASPPQDHATITPSVANARAELAASQPTAAPAQPSVFDSTPRSVDAPNSGSLVTGHWLDQSSMASSGNSKPATDAAPAPPQDDAQPAPQPTAPATHAAEATVERQSGSTQNLLMVMAGALALAGLVGGLLFRLNRSSTPPYEVDNEWRAPWDPQHERSQSPVEATREMRLRRARPPERSIHEPPPERSFEDTQREIKDMLARLAKSATA